jgi:DNA repair protein RadC
MQESQQNLNIKTWAEEDRPREKLLLKGKSALSDAELLAILIGSGSRNETAVELCKRILGSATNNLNQLAKLNVSELTKFKGMGEAKAITIIAALELGRRRKEQDSLKREKIVTSKDAFNVLYPDLADLPHEEFWVLFLNRANYVISKSHISKGGTAGTVADSKLIFKQAIEQLACTIVLCHNHPSGNLKPSEADIKLTKQLKETGKIIEIPVIDHLIIADNSYFSFADEGIL